VEISKDVTLILLIVGAAHEIVHVVSVEYLGVVTGRYGIEAESSSAFKQQIELDVAIALNAGIGRLTRGVALDERCDDEPFELFGVIKDVMVDAENLSHAARIVNVANRTASRIRRPTPEFQGGAHHLVTLLDQEARRDRRVDATTHCNEDFHGPSLPADVALRLTT
jgi:hypothetical protein